MITLYGIKNCDSVKKAQKWLLENNINYSFHDFKSQGLDNNLLTEFTKKSSWQLLLNKRSTSFRNLSEEIKNNLTDDVAFNAVLEQPTLLKRPLLAINNELHVGFKAPLYQELFSK